MEKQLQLVECKKINQKKKLIVIEVIYEKRIYHALIDSGSGISLTSHLFPNKRDIQTIKGRDIHNKESIFNQGYTDLWIIIGELKVKFSSIYYYPNIVYDFLIGQDFIDRNLPYMVNETNIYFTSPCGTQFFTKKNNSTL